MSVLFTIGHGDRQIDTFLDMLRAAGVRVLVDVRRYPGSRRHPQFGRDVLAAALKEAGIEYRWAGEALGGRRRLGAGSPHQALRNESFRAYADHMDTPDFRSALADLLALADSTPVAILCAERHPSQCHRSLISDAVLARGGKVTHLLEPGRWGEAALHPCARVEGARVVYDVGAQAGLDLPDA